MKYAELTKKLLALGCEFRRHGAGSHEIWRNPATGRQAAIPHHRGRETGPALQASLPRGLEIASKDFEEA